MANRLLLCARSEVFHAMLKSSGMSEERSGEVQIDDFDEKRECRAASEALFRMAHRYHVSSLMNLCLQHLASHICVDNAISRLILADWYGQHSLKALVLHFIVSHARDVLVDSDLFQTDRLSQALCGEVMVALARR
eukprot:gene23624-29863_t